MLIILVKKKGVRILSQLGIFKKFICGEYQCTGTIGTFAILAIFIIPPLTFLAGPLGPSTIMAADSPCFNRSKICIVPPTAPFRAVEPLIIFSPRFSTQCVIISPSIEVLIRMLTLSLLGIP